MEPLLPLLPVETLPEVDAVVLPEPLAEDVVEPLPVVPALVLAVEVVEPELLAEVDPESLPVLALVELEVLEELVPVLPLVDDDPPVAVDEPLDVLRPVEELLLEVLEPELLVVAAVLVLAPLEAPELLVLVESPPLEQPARTATAIAANREHLRMGIPSARKCPPSGARKETGIRHFNGVPP